MTCFDCKKLHPICKANCCGIVPFPKSIYYANQDKMNRQPIDTMIVESDIIPITNDGHCVFLNEDLSCNIYDQRPDVCRKYGDESHPMLCCPVLDKHGRERSRQGKRMIERQNNKYFKKHKLNVLQ